MKNITHKVPFWISSITIVALWWNYLRHTELIASQTRTFFVNVPAFKASPEYYQHLDYLYLRQFVIEEVLIIISAIIIIHGVFGHFHRNK